MADTTEAKKEVAPAPAPTQVSKAAPVVKADVSPAKSGSYSQVSPKEAVQKLFGNKPATPMEVSQPAKTAAAGTQQVKAAPQPAKPPTQPASQATEQSTDVEMTEETPKAEGEEVATTPVFKGNFAKL